MNFLSRSRLSLPQVFRRSPSIHIEDTEAQPDYWSAASKHLRYIDSVDAIEDRSEDSSIAGASSELQENHSGEYSKEKDEDSNRLEMHLLSPGDSETGSFHSIKQSTSRPHSGVSRTSNFKKLTECIKTCSWVEGETNQRRRQSTLHQNIANAKIEVEQTLLLMSDYRERKDLRYYFQHPMARLFVCYLVTLCNFLMFAEDPVSHSRAESVIPIMGNVFSFVFTKYPPEYSWTAVKFLPRLLTDWLQVLMWILAILCGLVFGKSVFHPILGRALRLKMFRDDQGSWMTMFLAVLVSLYLCSHVYNAILYMCRVDPAYRINSRMHITSASVMKAAACGSWLGDLITGLMVTDMMLQDTLYPEWAPKLRHSWRSSNAPRILLFWVGSAVATIVVLTLIISDWISWDQLNHDFIATTELSRAFLASFILVMDIIIVMQDWDFPHFTTTLHVNLPGLKVATLRCNFAKVKITGKWFNYGIIFCVMIFDLNMWKNQIFYDPSNYGQYTGEGDKIHTVIDRKTLQSGNNSLWSYRARMVYDPKTGRPLYNNDRVMNSRYLGYSMHTKWTAGIPSILGLTLFVSLIALYGRFPVIQGKNEKVAGERHNLDDTNNVTTDQ